MRRFAEGNGPRNLLLSAAGGLCLLAATGTAAAQTTIFEETFDTDLGSTTAVNGAAAPPNEWYFENTCPPNALGGHSGPGAARWGNPASCTDYGNLGTENEFPGDTDTLDTPAIAAGSCQAPLTLSFNYLLSYEEDAQYDRARVEIMVDGGAPIIVADNDGGAPPVAPAGRTSSSAHAGQAGLGNLINNNGAAWQALALDLSAYLPASTLQVRFVGETYDGLFNTGDGFYVDDVTVSCIGPAGIPTLSGWSLGLLGVLLLGTTALVQRRTRRQRG